MAEAALNHLGGGRFSAASAGSRPTGEVHPQSLALLESKGIPTAGLHSKSWDRFATMPFDIVITVCSAAAGEACPLFPGAPLKAHWGVPDPAQATGTADEISAAFEAAYATLARRIEALTFLPPGALTAAALQDIGRLE